MICFSSLSEIVNVFVVYLRLSRFVLPVILCVRFGCNRCMIQVCIRRRDDNGDIHYPKVFNSRDIKVMLDSCVALFNYQVLSAF